MVRIIKLYKGTTKAFYDFAVFALLMGVYTAVIYVGGMWGSISIITGMAEANPILEKIVEMLTEIETSGPEDPLLPKI